MDEKDDPPTVLTEEEEAADREDIALAAQVGYWAVPVIIVHLIFISLLIRAMTGIQFNALPYAMVILGFLWTQGGRVGVAFHALRRGRFPLADRSRVTGWKAYYLIAAFILIPFALFIAPSMIRTIGWWLVDWLS